MNHYEKEKQITVRIPEYLHRKLRIYALSKGTTTQDIVAEYLLRLLDGEENGEDAKSRTSE